METLEQDVVAAFGVKNQAVINGLTSLGFRQIGSPTYFVGLIPRLKCESFLNLKNVASKVGCFQ